MGRFTKSVLSPEGHDRRESGYYSTPNFVAEFLARELKRVNPDGKTALDPCVGKGEMSLPLSKKGIKVDGFDVNDMNPDGIHHFEKEDFLRYYSESAEDNLFSDKKTLEYDYFVLNPPYNCHEVDYIRKHKPWLKRAFGDVGVGNMYSMFISAVVDLAKPGAVIGMIVFDSFLTAKSHSALRAQILSKCKIIDLILCPQSLFRSQSADVRTCIMVMQVSESRSDRVRVADRPPTTEVLEAILENSDFEEKSLDQVILRGSSDLKEFVVGCPQEVFNLFSNRRIGDHFPCITGISTGNDSKYLSPTSNDAFTIPFYKNPAKRRFFTDPDAYLPEDFLKICDEVPNFMVRNKRYLFKEGITCSSMGVQFGAAYLPEGATYGVNANIFPPSEDLWWLLAFLNSSLCTYLVRGVLLRTNMITSGYVSRIPIPQISRRTKQRLGGIAKSIVNDRNREGVAEAVQEIDVAIMDDLGFGKSAQLKVREFALSVVTST